MDRHSAGVRWGVDLPLAAIRVPDIATMLIFIFILIFFDRRASERAAECYRQAVEACGERRVKRYSAGSTLVNLQEMSFGHNCEWECK
jgi:hypothetical protein